MSVAFASIKGITYFSSRKAFIGTTVFAPVEGTGVYMIDHLGRIVKYWGLGYKPAGYGELLPNTNLLYSGKVEDGPLADLEGAGGVLLEVGWDGNKVWEYKDPNLHHGFCRMKNGNTLVMKWVALPDDFATRVVGGDPGTERDGVMYGDVIQEIDSRGKVVWEWIGHEHLDPKDGRCPICPRATWTHASGVAEMPGGDIVVCFMLLNTVAIIDKKSGNIKWRWGTGLNELVHPHCPTVLDNGNILVFSNELHEWLNFPRGSSRVVEVAPSTSKMVWSYGKTQDSAELFWSGTRSGAQRLPNGNTFICEGDRGRLFEVTADGELVWEYVNGLPSYESAPTKLRHQPVYQAFKYDMDYSGLKRPIPLPEKPQAAPGTPVPTEGVARVAETRLKALGYG